MARFAPFVLGILAALMGMLLYRAVAPGPHILTDREVKQLIADSLASATAPPPFSEAVYSIIRRSLVLVRTHATEDDGLGSGVVFTDQGQILTSLHVVDGASNTGPLPLEAAQQAADRGVRVYAIGFGTPQGAEFPNCSAKFIGSEPTGFGGGSGFGGGNFGGSGFGGRWRRGIDEETLKRIAELTGAHDFPAESPSELERVFADLPTYTIMKHETTELSVFLVLFGAALAALAVVLSLIWHRAPWLRRPLSYSRWLGRGSPSPHASPAWRWAPCIDPQTNSHDRHGRLEAGGAPIDLAAARGRGKRRGRSRRNSA